jgi:hypothetical protein
MTPPPRARIRRPTARLQCQTPSRFVAMTSRHSVSGRSNAAPLTPTPALFTSTSIGPNSALTVSTARSTSSGSVTSSPTPYERMPRSASSAAAARAESSDRLVTATAAPASPRACAIARPSPLLPPVTSATVPSREKAARAFMKSEPFCRSLGRCGLRGTRRVREVRRRWGTARSEPGARRSQGSTPPAGCTARPGPPQDR